ncbi:putative conserved lipoprotein LppF [Mycobacterium kubicae]|uniref:phosphoserine phosphatase n=1 Tax=Mycobacterium kubicae TaxID=120959 RepID=A0AAX1J8F2_9MYCO|nr:haloacid dehalogenase-like hydrolase [Mycobacterium kubicae]QNI13960.1 haloacid dehalogenase-like hydrolase [Mycobacterium kubicae]QPI37471.1 haloacid dehalogenase-like hydrolase [Mycobacterium kubicae]GFG66266.1 putative conserved lipoprotein LppF [Mycobacterium kubicae]
MTLRAVVLLSLIMVTLSGCGHANDRRAAHGCRTLATDPGWYGDNRDRINAMIGQLGACGKTGSVADGAPLALFDWDNTTVRNDIGHATFFWIVRNSKIRQPRDWAATSQFLTPQAAAALTEACGTLSAVGQPIPTGSPAGTGCADELVSIYNDVRTRSGAAAFAGYNHRRFKPVDAWLLQLLAGWTDADVTGFATAARQENLDAAQGAEQTVGSTRQTAWVRYYPQMRDLIGTLQANGFDVRVISASPEAVVKVWAADVGITGDRVMGVRVEHDGDAVTTRLASCGGETSMPFNEGKRCRVNEQVFGMQGTAAFEQAPHRQVFGAGDSDGDVTFVGDATAARLVLNRNQIELMCRAYDNADGRWLVNPTFLNPMPKSPPYPCATKGFDEPDGGQAPLRRPDGAVVADQQDRVF